MSYRSSASFGKRIEFWVIGLLLKDGFDVYVPLVDDDGIDAILRGDQGRKLDIQIKARSSSVKFGSSALFTLGQSHPLMRQDFFFIFYSERLTEMWVMSSADFLGHCVTTKSGKNTGNRSIWMNGKSKKRNQEYPNPRFDPWRVTRAGGFDFDLLHAALHDKS
jgi:hypothetical protein